MASTSLRPRALVPLITVIGATGTGKSQLAIDLALHLRGEIINADAMQMYKGLPILTNKMPEGERMGVAHHFLGGVGVGEVGRVGGWVGGVRGVIEEVRARGNTPIIVGGTHYYVQELLYPAAVCTVGGGEEGMGMGMGEEGGGGECTKFPTPRRASPPTTILQKLQQVDPVMAARWHPNDYRKIKRSLEIYYLNDCVPASEVYRRQQVSKKKSSNTNNTTTSTTTTTATTATPGYRNLIFWVHSEMPVLEKRLDERVDNMVNLGLFEEIDEMWGRRVEEGGEVDLEKGVWQSIGFKEFLPYLEKVEGLKRVGAEGEEKVKVEKELEELKREGLERMKNSTRRYAKQQIKWIRIKFMNAMRMEEEEEEEKEKGEEEIVEGEGGQNKKGKRSILYLLDSTNPKEYQERVSKPALEIAKRFLAEGGGTAGLPDPFGMSRLAGEMLVPKREYDVSTRPDLWVRRVCEVCGVTTVEDEGWARHVQSSRHKRSVRGRRKKEE
ncbi:IPP transferase-domain-containing protein, partial [Peziza echinospora]